jgi:hypothetical protein
LIEAANETFCGAVPVVGETVSHAASLEAEKVSEPVPVFETAKLTGWGSEPPASAPMFTTVGVTARTGVVPAAELA